MNTHTHPLPARRQEGVVLVVALVMLIIIGLASVAVMRNVMNTDLVSENSRRQTQAMQAAHTALRYCETQIEADAQQPQAAPVAPATQESWEINANWRTDGALSAGQPISVPVDILNSGSDQKTRYSESGTDGAKRPQCMAQSRTSAGVNTLIVVTARGFSDNYVSRTDGTTEAGAVVWLQSIIQLAAEEG